MKNNIKEKKNFFFYFSFRLLKEFNKTGDNAKGERKAVSCLPVFILLRIMYL